MNDINIYIGICEDNNSDPLKMGRIKVRIFGIHTENRDSEEDQKQISINDLPWATPIFSIQSPTIDGFSDFQVPKTGSVVALLYLDEDKQKLVYFGTLPRIVKELPDWTFGFSDPDKKHPSENYLNESPISRLARNEKIDQTIIQTKRNSIKNNVDCFKASWNEPPSDYNAEYTKNRVIETEKHIIEIDDTDGYERIHIFHKTGSSIEMQHTGDVVDRINKSKYTIILQDDNILIEGNKNIKINGSENEKIDQSSNTKVGIDVNRFVGRKIYQQAGSEIRLKAPMIYLN